MRAQDAIVGAPVYLYQPGSITATLLAAPGAPTYSPAGVQWWDTSVVYGSQLFGFFTSGSVSVGWSTSETTPPIPAQGATPVVFHMNYMPTGVSENAGLMDTVLITTGGYNGPGVIPVYESAAVRFGENQTAEIGFAPAGTMVSNFSDYPIRIGVTNVFSTPGAFPDGGVGQVPEPEMWILTLAGVLGAGLLRRRKRVKHS